MNTKTKRESVIPRHLDDRVCADCGYGIAVDKAPFRCPICGVSRWIQSPLRRVA